MILGLTPARGGSKGIPRKNIKPIAGLPLIAWTIEAAKRSKLIDRYIVSTEDDEIAAVASKWGAEVLKRPPELAGDAVPTIAVLQHVISLVECSVIVLLQATSPVRGDGLIDHCINQFLNNDYDSLATGYLCKYLEYGKNVKRRQDIGGFFYDDGNVYVIKADLIRGGDRYGKKIGRIIPSRQESVEIDDEFDFWITEHILREGLVGNGI
jgi:CMP-N-acetylneuraminic acid synthetase